MTSIVLAYDAGPSAGMGHWRRMQALQQPLAHLGVSAELVETGGPPLFADVVVVDSYRHRADDRERFRANAVAALDDLSRDLRVDVLVDPSPGADSTAHCAAKRVLAGPHFAPLDPCLTLLSPRAVGPEVDIALVATGAADSAGVGARMAAALARLLPRTEVRMALGTWSDGDLPPGVVAVRTETGLGPALADADLVLTAAGVTLLESLALGRPTVAVILAENQRRAAGGAAAADAAIVGVEAKAAGLAAELAGDLERRRSLSAAARNLVDGRGAGRVAEAIVDLR